MKARIWPGLVVLAAAGCGGSGDGLGDRMGTGSGMLRNVSPGEVDKATRSLARGKSAGVLTATNEFGFKLFGELAKRSPDKNVFVSPPSISTALAMAYNGAAGGTREAMGKALNIENMSLQDLNEGEKQLVTLLSNPDPKVRLEIANSLWAKAGVEFKREYVGRIEDNYAAKPTVLDFASPTAPKTMNDWVEKSTQGKIKEIVTQIDPQAAMFLLNAVYFKGAWQDAFNAAQTEERDFTLFDGKTKKTPMMSRRADYSYLEGDKFKAVRIPFGTGRIGMVILLPDEKEQLKDVVKQMSAKNWTAWNQKFRPIKGTVIVPKFTSEFTVGLNDVLKDMGMGIAFTDQADFTGMREQRDLFLKDVLHRTFIEVNEEGAEAAAATKVEVGVTSMPIQKEFMFIVNRPFAYAIADRETGMVLFLGVMSDPVWEAAKK